MNCGENEEPGYGRRKRSLYKDGNNTENHHIFLGKTTNWEENLELKIRMPPDLLVNSKSSVSNGNHSEMLKSECKIYLIVTLSVALTFCVLSATIVVVACFKKYQETKAHLVAQSLEREEREQMTLKSEVKSVNSMPQFNPTSRPITVRSVKRRDKAKVEEKRMIRSLDNERTAAVMV